MIVIDSSAVVAIMFGEPTAGALATRLAATPAGDRLMSAANYVETGTVLAGRHRIPMQAVADLDGFLAEARITLAPVDEPIAWLALQARIQFGKGFGAGARLNFGDCFAYALAKARNAPLLFVGDDFAATDVSPAL
ncbi:MAG: type II toxin-antitoxin system VapC family toxin [Phycisphaerales bacterium]|nr:type II toxin-antitoxin system VapC family toxin [Hyphomonadaceae bacterium]